MERATGAIAGARLDAALSEEAETGRLLADAQERFFDLRQLLDVTHSDEARITALALSENEEVLSAREEYAPLLQDFQTKNLERAQRLVDLLARERVNRLAALEAGQAQAGQGSAPPAADEEADPIALENQRFDLAEQLLAMAEGAMMESRDALDSGAALDWPVLGEASGRARDHLDAIRTLFFTLVEHVRELAQDQIDTSDSTQDAIALSSAEQARDKDSEAEDPNQEDLDERGPEARARAGVLALEQGGLEERAGVIADALLAQSEQLAATDEEGGTPPMPPSGPAPAAGGADSADRMRQAAEHVALAQLSMRKASEGLGDDEQPIDPAHAAQQVAIEELKAALELLSPPPPPEDPQGDDQEEQDQQQDQQEQEGEESEPEPEKGQDESPGASENAEAPEEEPMSDPSQLLQGVRDREAERRRERERDQEQRRSQPVGKDW